MLARGLIGAAVLVYVVVLGCVINDAPNKKASADAANGVTPGGGSSPTSDDGGATADAARDPKLLLNALPYRGAGMQIQRVDWIDRYKHSVDEMADLGFDTVSFVIDTRMENGRSSSIWLDMRMTPTPEKLSDLIKHAKGKGMRVILMPIVLLDNPVGTEWRGTLKPEYWPDWFKSYTNMMIHFAWIAEQNKVDVLSVGSELVSAEREKSEWRKLIRTVREVYKGQLTYSANWDHYTSIPFWDQLDLIGMNSYYKLGEDKHVKVEEVVRRWKDIQKDLLAFQRKVGKPLLFLEVGWCSLENAADEPWDYTKTDLGVDLDLQKRLYEGFFQAWYRDPALGGFMIWEWTPEDGGPEDKGYTPENKPAEDVLKQWLAKPWRSDAAG